MMIRKELHGLPQGWFHHGEKILELIDKYRPVQCVELGSWRGASAIAIARVIGKWSATLTCVDTWTGDVDQFDGPSSGVPGMLTECANNLIQDGVMPWVRLIPAGTVAVAQRWNGPLLDFLYVDAGHAYQSTKDDLEAWWGHLKRGGLILGDDYGSPRYPGVALAWDEFERNKTQTFIRYTTPGVEPVGLQLIYGVKQ